MAKKVGVIYGDKANEQVKKTVHEVARRMMNEQPHRGRWQNHPQASNLSHGIVNADLGCGYYTIELATHAPTIPEDPGCDACGMAADPQTRCGEIEIVYPDSENTGLGTYVTARDVASPLIPLVVGSDCIIANLGDEDGGTAVWQVVRGLQKHAVVYEEEGSCCDGEGESGIPTLLTVTPIVVIGFRCEPVECGTCTP